MPFLPESFYLKLLKIFTFNIVVLNLIKTHIIIKRSMAPHHSSQYDYAKNLFYNIDTVIYQTVYYYYYYYYYYCCCCSKEANAKHR